MVHCIACRGGCEWAVWVCCEWGQVRAGVFVTGSYFEAIEKWMVGVSKCMAGVSKCMTGCPKVWRGCPNLWRGCPNLWQGRLNAHWKHTMCCYVRYRLKGNSRLAVSRCVLLHTAETQNGNWNLFSKLVQTLFRSKQTSPNTVQIQNKLVKTLFSFRTDWFKHFRFRTNWPKHC
jgi:hypothetical protein